MANRKKKTEPAPSGTDIAIASEDDVALVEQDRTGWAPHSSERRDFHNRIRAFPLSVSVWRKKLLERVRTGTPPLPINETSNNEKVCDHLDEGISYLREVSRILAIPSCTGHPISGTRPTRLMS